MKRFLFLLLFIPVFSFSQGESKSLECFCKENEFKQTFEINFEKEQIKRSSSVNLKNGEFFKGELSYIKDVNFIGDSKNGFIICKELKGYVSVKVFDLKNLTLVQDTYDSDGSSFNQFYTCFWHR